jgi:hypothetical protein
MDAAITTHAQNLTTAYNLTGISSLIKSLILSKSVISAEKLSTTHYFRFEDHTVAATIGRATIRCGAAPSDPRRAVIALRVMDHYKTNP